MQELIQRLFESTFMPHGHCYLWQPSLLWLHAGSDALIALSYFTIPFLLVWFVSRRRDLAFRWMFGLFGLFIFFCGTTHLMNIWTIWNGAYWVSGLVKLSTGVISVATAALLVPLVPKALQLPAPAELRRANQLLKDEIEQRKRTEAELAEAYEKLKETERLKGEFFANVSHELRTPLTLILLPVEALLEAPEALSRSQRQMLKAAHNNSIRLLQMVSGLLDFSRLEIGEVQVEREATDIVALTRAVYEDFGPLVERNGLAAEIKAVVDRPVIAMDRYLYERILFNLLSNAVKFTPEGGTVTVSLQQEADRIELAVSDTGDGIPEWELANIFKDFRQIDASATRRFEGTGLGLSLVKEFSERLDGGVTVESTPGEGSTFTVALRAPVAEQGRGAPSIDRSWAVAQQHAASPSPERIAADVALPDVVLAEDNKEMAAYIEKLLSETCHLHVATDGHEALRLVQTVRPEVVITDLMMPEMDGLSLCRVLKDNPTTAEVPVVVLTALTNRKALLHGWEAGADEYLFKPFHPRELVTRIQTLLRGIERRREAEATVRRLERELLRTSERERRRIGRDLHDGLASHLTGMALLARSLVRNGKDQPAAPETSDRLQEIAELAGEGARQARTMARRLNPVKLDEKGFAAALQTLAEDETERSGTQCRFEQVGPPPSITEGEAVNLYWIVHEAVQDALKHRDAHRLSIRLVSEPEAVRIEVCDDGRPRSSVEDVPDHRMGVQMMQYRAAFIGASLMHTESKQGENCCVQCALPVEKDREELNRDGVHTCESSGAPRKKVVGSRTQDAER